jgi:1-deoxy-D-xylulose-5-phosphate synthase
VLIHAVTQKGRGYKPAEEAPEIFHGVGCYDPDTGICVKNDSCQTYTQLFAQSLLAEAQQDERVVAITSAMTSGTGLNDFAKCFPERLYDVGISEEHAVTLASGMALAGLHPVVAIYSTFLQRAFDQTVINVALQKLPIVFCIDRGGLVGEDGPTHHGALDIAFLRTIPNMRILVPATAEDMAACLHLALSSLDPIAIRYPRGVAVELPAQLPQGDDVAILALGRFVKTAVDAAELLKADGINASVTNMLWAKPINKTAIDAACNTKLIVTLEEGTVVGGFGSAVLEYLALSAKPHPPVKVLGLPDAFVTHGSTDELLTELSLTPPQIAQTIKTAMSALQS